MKAIRTWVVLADGARARILLNSGPGKGLKPVLEREDEAARKPTRDQGTDRPGRVHDRSGPGRHSMEPRVDWHEFEKDRFARELSDLLDGAAQRNSFDRLILVAPPTTLGKLRTALSDKTKRLVTGELAKDLTKASDSDLPNQLAKTIAV